MDERQQRIEKSRAETEAGLARLEALSNPCGQKSLTYAKWVFTFAQQTDKIQKNVEALQEENKRLTAAWSGWLMRYQRLRDEV